MKKRLIDIYPPRSTDAFPPNEEPRVSQARETSKFTREGASKKALFAGLLLFLFAVPPIFLHLFFSKAHIELWPSITKLRLEEQISAQVGYTSVHLEKRIIRASAFEEKKELTQLFPASGKKLKEEKARGTIRVYNENSAQPQTLVANTRFISEDGRLFRLQATAVIPVGFLDVKVVASEAGPEYNIGPSNFSLPGLVGSPLYTKIYAKSFEPISGGAKKEVTVVTEEDIAKAKNQLTEILKTQAIKSLLEKVPPQFQVLEHSLNSTILEDNSLVKAGAELDQFTYKAKAKVEIFGFHKDDADLLARHILTNYLAPSQAINEETLRFSYTIAEGAVGPANTKGVIPITTQIVVDQYEKIEKEKLLARVAGMPNEEFRQLPQEYPFLAKVQFSLWPFWSSHIPQDLKRVNIDVHLTSW